MFQKLIIVGNLGSEPEMRYMPDGQAVTNFSLACNRRWNDRSTGQQQEEVTWYRVSVWGRQAEAVNEYLSKGRQVLILKGGCAQTQLLADRVCGHAMTVRWAPRLRSWPTGCSSWAATAMATGPTATPPASRSLNMKQTKSRSEIGNRKFQLL